MRQSSDEDYDGSEIVGRTFVEFTHPDDRVGGMSEFKIRPANSAAAMYAKRAATLL